MMNYRGFSHLSEDIKRGLIKLQAAKFDLVVGIPRSGMVPAYMIGLYLNVGVTSLDGLLADVELKKGSTRKSRVDLNSAQKAKKILLVDDSISSGESLKKVLATLPDDIRQRVTTLAVYSSIPERNDVDIFLEYVPEPRVFEWNIFHRSILAQSGVDIDGVLCRDPTAEENDDGARYIEFLLNTEPLILPSYKIHSLVTNRLEKYRPQTQEWLKKWGVEYDYLIMLNLPSAAERQRLGQHAQHKANYYNKSKLNFFIESEVGQAKDIARISGKPVYCVDSTQVYDTAWFYKAVDANGALDFSRQKAKIARMLPKGFVSWTRRVLR
jgi:uncharacterized HAD superfamily protein/pyrimidine operon attenuation protein/uracil phosphoribosyltransferase